MILEKNTLRKVALGLAMVVEISVLTMSGYALGYFLDSWIKRTTPWLTVLCLLVGFIAGFFRLYKVMTRQNGSNDKS